MFGVINNLISIKEDFSSDNPTIKSSLLFLFDIYQYFGMIFIFNFMSLNRQDIIKNKTYVIYFVLILGFVTSMLTSEVNNKISIYNFFIKLFPETRTEDDYNFQLCRIYVITLACANFLCVLAYEKFINFILIRK